MNKINWKNILDKKRYLIAHFSILGLVVFGCANILLFYDIALPN